MVAKEFSTPHHHSITMSKILSGKGTINVPSTCLKTPSVKRVVLTSSIASVAFNGMPRTPETIVDETWFADPEYCRAAKLWYVLSKTLAENAAWKFAKENDLQLVWINAEMVIGPLLQPTLNTSAAAVLLLIKGKEKRFSIGLMQSCIPSGRTRAHCLHTAAIFPNLLNETIFAKLPLSQGFNLPPLGRYITMYFTKYVTEYFTKYVTEYFTKYVTEYFTKYVTEYFTKYVTEYFTKYVTEYFTKYVTEYFTKYVTEYFTKYVTEYFTKYVTEYFTKYVTEYFTKYVTEYFTKYVTEYFTKYVTEYFTKYVTEYFTKYVTEYFTKYVTEYFTKYVTEYFTKYVTEYFTKYVTEYFTKYVTEYVNTKRTPQIPTSTSHQCTAWSPYLNGHTKMLDHPKYGSRRGITKY
uniref:NAD-dependent epimerase/dehydratase domain-containing protein n=1 Tax=Brassica oleracea var. oleracea TaxID=109376 RepID=A0A0D3CS74_BRAOL